MTMNDCSKTTIICAVKGAAQILLENGISNSFNDSFEMLASLNGMDKAFYYSHGDECISHEVYEKFMDMVNKRANHIPLQHILGKAWFFGNEFIVNEDVLVPRPDTEILVEEAIKVTGSDSLVLDMCTGSGCIILTLSKQNHLKNGIGVDLSQKALSVAMANADNLNVVNVTFVQSDLFTNIDDSRKFDCIVSNPPYIKSADIEELDDEVKIHDPRMALDGMEDGLEFYRRITNEAGRYLCDGGWLIYEIGYDQAEDVTKIMRECNFTDVAIIKDYSGLDRVVKGRFNYGHV